MGLNVAPWLWAQMCAQVGKGGVRAIFGETGNAGRRECAVISPDVDRVKVLLHAQNTPHKEEVWSVHRHEGRVSFERLDGTAVIATIE